MKSQRFINWLNNEISSYYLVFTVSTPEQSNVTTYLSYLNLTITIMSKYNLTITGDKLYLINHKLWACIVQHISQNQSHSSSGLSSILPILNCLSVKVLFEKQWDSKNPNSSYHLLSCITIELIKRNCDLDYVNPAAHTTIWFIFLIVWHMRHNPLNITFQLYLQN